MKLVILAVCLAIAAIAGAQNTIPEFGKVDKAELSMTQCSFDKDAEAMMIVNEAESYFKINIGGTFPVMEQTTYRTRIKIFTKDGFSAANIKIRYPTHSDDIAVKGLTAYTYNLDDAGNVVATKLDKESVYDKKINARYSEKTFVMPGVKEGSVIEFKYTMTGTSADVWYFQKSIPVRFSRFVLDFPSEVNVKIIPHYTLPVQKTNAGGSFSSYIMQNIPGLRDEPFMTTKEDYLQRMEIQPTTIYLPGRPVYRLNSTWGEVVKRLREDDDFGQQLKKDIPRTSDLDALLKNLSDPYAKMYTIHKYVRSNMVWDKYDNIWAMSGVKSAWKDKKGTSGEINLILINLLKDAGLDASPLLVSTRENGVINSLMPSTRQFNKVLAYVQIGNDYYVLDAVDKYTPAYLIPGEVMASDALLVKGKESEGFKWVNLWDGWHKEKSSTYINADVKEDGTISGSAAVISVDYARVAAMEELSKGSDNLVKKNFSLPNVTVDNFTVSNADTDTLQLIQSCKFNTAANASGAYNYFTVNLFSGLHKNPFIADERDTDIFYGVNKQFNLNATFNLPEGYEMNELPKNLKMIMSDSGMMVQRVSSFEEGTLRVVITVDFNTPIFSVESYPEFKEFYKKMLELIDEKYVYRKK